MSTTGMPPGSGRWLRLGLLLAVLGLPAVSALWKMRAYALAARAGAQVVEYAIGQRMGAPSRPARSMVGS